MNFQLSLKQRNQFSICYRARPLVQAQYLQRFIKKEAIQWQWHLQSCFTEGCIHNPPIQMERKAHQVYYTHMCISVLSFAGKILANLAGMNILIWLIFYQYGFRKDRGKGTNPDSKATPKELPRTKCGTLHDFCRPNYNIWQRKNYGKVWLPE